MAPRKFSDYMAELREWFSQIDPGECSDRIWRAIVDIANEENLAFLIGESKLVTEAAYSTGTVSVTAGSTAITLTSGTWDPTWTKRQIIISGRGERYGVTITGATTGTLADAWQGTTLTGLSYRMFRDTYSLPSDCEFGKEIVWYDTAIFSPLDFTDYETFTQDRQDFRSARASIPVEITRGGLDSNGLPQIIFDPPPGSARVYNLTYYRSPQRPANLDTALSPPWPDGFHDVIALRAGWEWADRRSHPRRVELRDRYRSRMRQMRSAYDGGNELRRRLGPAAGSMARVRGEITLYGGTYSVG